MKVQQAIQFLQSCLEVEKELWDAFKVENEHADETIEGVDNDRSETPICDQEKQDGNEDKPQNDDEEEEGAEKDVKQAEPDAQEEQEEKPGQVKDDEEEAGGGEEIGKEEEEVELTLEEQESLWRETEWKGEWFAFRSFASADYLRFQGILSPIRRVLTWRSRFLFCRSCLQQKFHPLSALRFHHLRRVHRVLVLHSKQAPSISHSSI